MHELRLGSKSDMSIVKGLKAKDVLSFLENGTVCLKGFSYIPVRSCLCGKRAVFVRVEVFPRAFMYCDVDVCFLCEDCYNDIKKV